MSSESTNNTKRKRPRNGNHRNNQGRNNSNRRSNNGRPRRGGRPPAPKLTWWQKLLKALGLYKAPSAPARKKSTAPKETSDSRPAKKETARKRSKPAPPQEVVSNRLYVGNLSYDVSEHELVDLFKGFGDVKKAEVVYNNRTHRSKGFAFVEMVSVEDAKRSVEVLHEQPFMGRNLIVNGARTKEDEDSLPSSEENNTRA